MRSSTHERVLQAKSIAPIRRENFIYSLAYVTRYSADGELYRGDVQEILDDGCEIYFIDFSNVDFVKFDKF